METNTFPDPRPPIHTTRTIEDSVRSQNCLCKSPYQEVERLSRDGDRQQDWIFDTSVMERRSYLSCCQPVYIESTSPSSDTVDMDSPARSFEQNTSDGHSSAGDQSGDTPLVHGPTSIDPVMNRAIGRDDSRKRIYLLRLIIVISGCHGAANES